MNLTKQTIPVIAFQIGVPLEDFQLTIDRIIKITAADLNRLEIVKVWKIQQIKPDLFDWWEILVFNPISDENEEYYFLLDVLKWDKDRHPEVAPEYENVNWLEGSDEPINISCGYEDNCIIELIFESDTHEPAPYKHI